MLHQQRQPQPTAQNNFWEAYDTGWRKRKLRDEYKLEQSMMDDHYNDARKNDIGSAIYKRAMGIIQQGAVRPGDPNVHTLKTPNGIPYISMYHAKALYLTQLYLGELQFYGVITQRTPRAE